MKRIIIVLAVATIAFGCKENEKREIESLKQKVETLQKESTSKDSTINNFFRVLNEIETNISLIMQKEQIIAKNAALGSEMQTDTRERIENDIQTINELMTKNKQAINYLNKQLKGANFKITEFESRLAQAQNMIEMRDAQVETLKERLAQLDFSVEVLNATVDTLTLIKQQLEQEVERKQGELNAAWYAFGTRKELLDNNVIEKAGGFLGLGKSFKLKADFNETYFTKIDITETLSIPLFTKKASLITTHPSDSYELTINESGIIEKLDIVNPNSFWGTTKYLVVQVD